MALVHQMTRPRASELVAVVHRLKACLPDRGERLTLWSCVDGVGLGAESRADLLPRSCLLGVWAPALGEALAQIQTDRKWKSRPN
ncbi:hypothetical protein CCMA1212_008821 [Trichoderma ghanense]|uniref:Uncharacterized protein n=1 Tax=Trichoderma ghanense TaxID=65468 RepID=A0ABY2GUY7_9HYPO